MCLLNKDDEGKGRVQPAKVGAISLLLVVIVGFLFVVQDFASSSSSSSFSSSSSSFFFAPASSSSSARKAVPLTGESAKVFNAALVQVLARARMENLETPLREQDYTKHLIERVAVYYFTTEAPLARLLRDILAGVLNAPIWTVGENSREGQKDDEEIFEGSAGSLVEIAPRHSVRGKPVHVWFTTHAPPYGYGKGHGLSGDFFLSPLLLLLP